MENMVGGLVTVFGRMLDCGRIITVGACLTVVGLLVLWAFVFIKLLSVILKTSVISPSSLFTLLVSDDCYHRVDFTEG
jgi:hypothetical protein